MVLDTRAWAEIFAAGALLYGAYRLLLSRDWRREEWEAEVSLTDKYVGETAEYGTQYTEYHVEYVRTDGSDDVISSGSDIEITDADGKPIHLSQIRVGDRLSKRRGETVVRFRHGADTQGSVRSTPRDD